MSVSLLACMKDEGPFILEWLSHHMAIGFDDIAITSNDCTDGTDKLLNLLSKAGVIEHYPVEVNPELGAAITGYRHVFPMDIIQKAEWVAVIDCDEFINPHIGSGRMNELLALYEDVDILCMNWKCFGDDGAEDWDGAKPVTESFLYGSTSNDRRSRAIKSITHHPKKFKRLNCHRPDGFPNKKPIIYANAAGARFEYLRRRDGPKVKVFRSFPKRKISHQDVQVNHYIVKNLPAFILKTVRGASFSNSRYSFERFYCRYSTFMLERDESILRFKPARDEIRKSLESIPGVKALSDEMVRNYQKKMQFARTLIAQHEHDLPESFDKIIDTINADETLGS